jgi:hypothetical protein
MTISDSKLFEFWPIVNTFLLRDEYATLYSIQHFFNVSNASQTHVCYQNEFRRPNRAVALLADHSSCSGSIELHNIFYLASVFLRSNYNFLLLYDTESPDRDTIPDIKDNYQTDKPYILHISLATAEAIQDDASMNAGVQFFFSDNRSYNNDDDYNNATKSKFPVVIVLSSWCVPR